MSAVNLTLMSEAEFLGWQLRQDELYEFVDGVPVPRWKAMSGATLRHDRVLVNALLSLGTQLRGGKCRPMTADVAVRIPKRNYRRPDLTVDCGTAKSDRELAAPEPRFAMEVLSTSTTNFDLFRRLEEYKTVATLRVVLLVDTESPQVTVHHRVNGIWQSNTLEGLDKTIELPEIEARMTLADLFEGIVFEETAGS